MKKLFIITTSLMCFALLASAQVELAIQGSYEIPIDEMKWVFKPGQGVNLTVSKTKHYRKKRTALGFTLGYSKYVPKQDIFYYLVNGEQLGTIQYDNMNMYQLSVQIRRDFILQKHLELFYGMEIGYQYTQYGYESHDTFIDEDSHSFIGRGAVAAKGGVGFPITDHVGIFLQTKYLVSIGPSDNHDNVINIYWNNSFGVNIRF